MVGHGPILLSASAPIVFWVALWFVRIWFVLWGLALVVVLALALNFEHDHQAQLT